MNEPQLEDFAQDKYSQLNPEPWGDSDQFVEWMQFSDHPDAQAL